MAAASNDPSVSADIPDNIVPYIFCQAHYIIFTIDEQYRGPQLIRKQDNVLLLHWTVRNYHVRSLPWVSSQWGCWQRNIPLEKRSQQMCSDSLWTGELFGHLSSRCTHLEILSKEFFRFFGETVFWEIQEYVYPSQDGSQQAWIKCVGNGEISKEWILKEVRFNEHLLFIKAAIRSLISLRLRLLKMLAESWDSVFSDGGTLCFMLLLH